MASGGPMARSASASSRTSSPSSPPSVPLSTPALGTPGTSVQTDDLLYTSHMSSSVWTPDNGSQVHFMSDDVDATAKSGVARAVFNVVCTVVGAGILQLPAALQQGGWVAAAPLVGFAFVAAYTAILVGKCLRPPRVTAVSDGVEGLSEDEDEGYITGPPTNERTAISTTKSKLRNITVYRRKAFTSYGEIGEAAFGKYGGWFCSFMCYLNLVGASTLYLILSGTNLVYLLKSIPNPSDASDPFTLLKVSSHVGIAIMAGLLWFHIFLKTLHEVGVLSFFNISVAAFLAITVIVEIFINLPDEKPHHDVIANSVLRLGGSFSSMVFSYGAHSVLPAVHETLKDKSKFNMIIVISFTIILVFYIPLATIGYWAYGVGTCSPIYDNICPEDDLDSCSYGEQLGLYLAVLSVSVHVAFSYALNINPVERAIEKQFQWDDHPHGRWFSYASRTALVLVTFGVAQALPDFADFLDLLASITSTFVIFIIPCTCYVKLYWHTNLSVWEIVCDVLIVVVALVGGFFGVYYAVLGILCNVFDVSYACDEVAQGACS